MLTAETETSIKSIKNGGWHIIWRPTESVALGERAAAIHSGHAGWQAASCPEEGGDEWQGLQREQTAWQDGCPNRKNFSAPLLMMAELLPAAPPPNSGDFSAPSSEGQSIRRCFKAWFQREQDGSTGFPIRHHVLLCCTWCSLLADPCLRAGAEDELLLRQTDDYPPFSPFAGFGSDCGTTVCASAAHMCALCCMMGDFLQVFGVCLNKQWKWGSASTWMLWWHPAVKTLSLLVLRCL